jgi:hypothetical protein
MNVLYVLRVLLFCSLNEQAYVKTADSMSKETWYLIN